MKNKEINIRTLKLNANDVNVRENQKTQKHEISGYAVKFDVPSEDMGFIEFIDASAFDGVDLKTALLIYAHDYNKILARADAGSLQLRIDKTGLFFDATLADTTLANDVVADIQAGNIKGCSFGFTIAENGDEWIKDENGQLIHQIKKIDELFEVTLTPIPAYTQTSVAVQRSLENYKKHEEREKLEDTEIEKLKTELAEIRSLIAKKEDKEDKDKKDNEKEDKEQEDKEDNENKETKKDKDKSSRDDDKEVEDQEEEEKRSKQMGKIITPEVKEDKVLRDFKAFLKGEKRDLPAGFDTAAGEAVIPSQVLDVMKQPNDPAQLGGYVNRVQVTAPTGKLPVMKKASVSLATAAELADNPKLANASIDKVNYDVMTLRGALPISMEMVQDYPNITGLLAEYVDEVKSKSEQERIGAVLQTATSVTAKTIDDLKVAFHQLVNYGADRMFVVSQSAATWLDTQKDANGRYLLQDSVTSATGKVLFGAPILEVADEILGAAGESHVFVGSLKAFVLEALRSNLNVAWIRNENFEQVLQVVLRADFKAADTDAGQFLTIPKTVAASTGK